MLNKQQQPLDMFSLYDYLGYPAGSKLGEQVAAYATLRKTKFGTRQVNTSSYKGEVMMYTKAFLDECFNTKKIFEPKQEDLTEINTLLVTDNDNLPF